MHILYKFLCDLDLKAAAMMISANHFQFSEANFAKDQNGPF